MLIVDSIAIGLLAIAFLTVLIKPTRIWSFYAILVGLLPFLWELMSPLFGPVTATGFGTLGIAFLPIIIVTLLPLIWVLRKASFTKGPLFYPLLFLIGAAMLSLINAESVQAGLMIVFAEIYLLLAYLSIYNTITKFSQVQGFVKFYLISCVILSIYGVYLWQCGLTTKGVNPFGRVGVLDMESNHFAFICVEGMFLSIFLCLFSRQRLESRTLYFISFIVLFSAIIFTFSRGVWLSAIASLLYLVLVYRFRGKRLRLRLIAFSFVALFIGFMIFYGDPYLHSRFLGMFGGVSTSPMRYEADKAAWSAFLMHPFLGVGINNFVVHALGHTMAGTANLYSRMLAETGIIGFIAFLLVIFKTYRAISKGVSLTIPGSKEQLIQLGFLAGFLANAIDFLFFGVILPLWWIFFFIGISSARVLKERAPDGLLPSSGKAETMKTSYS